MNSGLSISDAARRLSLSEPTVRRRLGKDLEEIPGSRPKLVTSDSVERLRTARLEQLGVHGTSQPHPQPDGQSEIARLRAENERLRAVIQSLRLANRALDDALGQITAPLTPNN